MATYKFQCKLLSDVVISQNAATEGEQKTLDFIPGGNFLGIAASSLYDKFQKMGLANLVFHSGKIRFGDAHAAADGYRSLKVPASMYYPKLKSVQETCYIHHLYDRQLDKTDNGHPAQLKQCRNNFYIFKDNVAKEVRIPKTFAIKSAYDRVLRKSEDEKMYGYESMRKGCVLYFEIDFCGIPSEQEKELFSDIKNAIEGRRHIGRSKTAQYGLVDIKHLDPNDKENPEKEYDEVASGPKSCNFATVYADGRLIFTDDYGLPKILPDARDLGFGPSDRILWDKSQIRTFRYAPWNSKRQSRDTDRCGIEKGSVFVVECSSSPVKSAYIGNFKSEGFGKVIYNPDFLQSSGGNGLARYTIVSAENDNTDYTGRNAGGYSIPAEYTALIEYLDTQKNDWAHSELIYNRVNEFVEKYSRLFTGCRDKFASQWGSIRALAAQSSTLSRNTGNSSGNLYDALFQEPDGYLVHGTAKDKWLDKNRIGIFKDFMDRLSEDSLSESEKIQTIINLASEMAKKCK